MWGLCVVSVVLCVVRWGVVGMCGVVCEMCGVMWNCVGM